MITTCLTSIGGLLIAGISKLPGDSVVLESRVGVHGPFISLDGKLESWLGLGGNGTDGPSDSNLLEVVIEVLRRNEVPLSNDIGLDWHVFLNINITKVEEETREDKRERETKKKVTIAQ